MTPATVAYWRSANLEPPTGAVALQPQTGACATLLPHALASLGLTVEHNAPLLVVTTDDYIHPEISRIASTRKEPWLLAKPVGHTLWLGPLFVPGITVCYDCLARWIKPHRSDQAAEYGWGRDDFPPEPATESLSTTTAWAAAMIATAAAHCIARGDYPDLHNTVLAIDTRDFSQSRNPVRPWPDCPHCGAFPRAVPTPATFHQFLSPITGIVQRLQIGDRPIGGLYHAHAIFAAPLPHGPIRHLLKPQHAAGKGATPEEAEWKAIAEALERYSLIYRGDEPIHRAPAERFDAIPLADLLLFSESQYRHRDRWNAEHSELHWVPDRVAGNTEIDWVEARSLTHPGRVCAVPAAYCYMDFPHEPGRDICAADTNGCAAGPTLEAATLAALLELVERDAVAIWWYNRIPRHAAPIDSFRSPDLDALAAAFAKTGRSAHLLDITTDLGIPAYAAVVPRHDGSEPVFGCAAGLSSEEAAYKALSEAAQICCWLSAGGGSDELRSWVLGTRATDHRYLQPEGVAHPTLDAGHNGSLDSVLSRLARAGLEAFVLDLTRGEVGLPVVRAIVPGLRHFWGRLAPGRLYDIPVAMGWRTAPLAESELNPVPCMI